MATTSDYKRLQRIDASLATLRVLQDTIAAGVAPQHAITNMERTLLASLDKLPTDKVMEVIHPSSLQDWIASAND